MLPGCSSSDADMNAYVGQPSSVLLARLGTPKLRAPGENGGQIWTYIEESRISQAAPAMPGSFTGGAGVAPPASSLSSPVINYRREFFIDSSGVIYRFQSKGR